MKIGDIKSKLGIETFNLNYTVDQVTGERSDWLRHWDNDNRVAVNIHEDTLAEAKSGKDLHTFGLKKELGLEAPKGSYDRYTIVLYRTSDEIL